MMMGYDKTQMLRSHYQGASRCSVCGSLAMAGCQISTQVKYDAPASDSNLETPKHFLSCVLNTCDYAET
jgi:hypothetical protein